MRRTVVWNALQSDLECDEAMPALLGWFEVLPDDPSLTRARIEWLRLALLDRGELERAAEVRRIVGPPRW